MSDIDERDLTRFSWASATDGSAALHAPAMVHAPTHSQYFAQHLPLAVAAGGGNVSAMSAVPAYTVVIPSAAAPVHAGPADQAMALAGMHRRRFGRHDGMLGIAVGLMILILPVSGAVMMGLNNPAAPAPKAAAASQAAWQQPQQPVQPAATSTLPTEMQPPAVTQPPAADTAADKAAAKAKSRAKLLAWRKQQRAQRAADTQAKADAQRRAEAQRAAWNAQQQQQQPQQPAQPAPTVNHASHTAPPAGGGGGATGGGGGNTSTPQVQPAPQQPAATETATS